MKEIWKNIDGYDGRYQVSNYGRIKSLYVWDVNKRDFVPAEKIMTPTDNGNGYLIVSLRKNRLRKNYYVHRLVASVFIAKRDGCDYINHIDHNKKNNNADNLEWCTQKENVGYSADRMKHRNSLHIANTNTGEKYIYFRKGRYRVVVDKKEYPSCVTLSEAVEKRNKILEKGVV